MDELIITAAMAIGLVFIFNKLLPLKRAETGYTYEEKHQLPL